MAFFRGSSLSEVVHCYNMCYANFDISRQTVQAIASWFSEILRVCDIYVDFVRWLILVITDKMSTITVEVDNFLIMFL